MLLLHKITTFATEDSARALKAKQKSQPINIEMSDSSIENLIDRAEFDDSSDSDNRRISHLSPTRTIEGLN